APLEDVALDDPRAVHLALPSALLGGPDVDEQRACGARVGGLYGRQAPEAGARLVEELLDGLGHGVTLRCCPQGSRRARCADERGTCPARRRRRSSSAKAVSRRAG